MDTRKKTIYTLVLIIVFLLLLVIFTLQNTETVAVTFFFWDFKMSTALVILIPLAVGLLIGWLGIPFIMARKKGSPLVKKENEGD